MMIIYYLILGIVQGVVEALPISSSGHLLVCNEILTSLFNFKDSVNTEILATITNFGSLIAVIIIYFSDLVLIVRDFFSYVFSRDKKSYSNYKYGLYIILATIPVGIIGLVVSKLGFFDALEKNISVIGLTLIITGVFLFLIRNIKGSKKREDITFKDALTVGFFEMFGLIPGISRSGSTIVGGMYKGLDRLTAFDFSFMLYIPISFCTTLLGVSDLISSNLSNLQIFYYLFSAFISCVFTYIAVKWFRNIIKNGKLIYFSIYCFIVGILIMIFL